MNFRFLKNEEGISLMEVIILAVVAALFIIGLMPLITGNLVQNNQSKYRLQAYQAAQQEIEKLRNTTFDSLVSGNFSVPASLPSGQGTVTISNDIDGDGDEEENIVKARVDVSFREKTETETTTLTTFLTK